MRSDGSGYVKHTSKEAQARAQDVCFLFFDGCGTSACFQFDRQAPVTVSGSGDTVSGFGMSGSVTLACG